MNEFYQEPTEQLEEENYKAIKISEVSSSPEFKTDDETLSLLELVVKQNPALAHVEVHFVNPEDEPNTGGFFRRIQTDENTVTPAIFIVEKDRTHLNNLLRLRRSSAEIVAGLLGIEFRNLTPDTLRKFIICHELGHATDYVNNYESNPELTNNQAADEWDMHYQSVLMTLPVPGLNPAQLKVESRKYVNVASFLKTRLDMDGGKKQTNYASIGELQHAQEVAYRESSYENYADNFAADFIKGNAVKLNILELVPDNQAVAA